MYGRSPGAGATPLTISGSSRRKGICRREPNGPGCGICGNRRKTWRNTTQISCRPLLIDYTLRPDGSRSNVAWWVAIIGVALAFIPVTILESGKSQAIIDRYKGTGNGLDAPVPDGSPSNAPILVGLVGLLGGFVGSPDWKS